MYTLSVDPITQDLDRYMDKQDKLETAAERREQWIKDETLRQVTKDQEDPEKVADALVEMIMNERELLADKVIDNDPVKLLATFQLQFRTYLISNAEWSVTKEADKVNFDE